MVAKRWAWERISDGSAARQDENGRSLRRPSSFLASDIANCERRPIKQFTIGSLAATALAAAALTNPAATTNPAAAQSDQQNQPGTGGTSKPGVQGLPDSKAGPTARPDSAMLSPPPSPSQYNETTGSSEPQKAGSPASPVPAPDSSTEAGQRSGASGRNPAQLRGSEATRWQIRSWSKTRPIGAASLAASGRRSSRGRRLSGVDWTESVTGRSRAWPPRKWPSEDRSYAIEDYLEDGEHGHGLLLVAEGRHNLSTRASQKLDRASQKEVAGTELQLRQNLAAGCECRKK